MALDFASSPWLQSTTNIPAYNAYTLCYWYQTDSATSDDYNTLLSLEDTSSNVHLLQTGASGSGNLYLWIEATTTTASTGFLPSTGDNWYFIALTGDSSNVTQYWAVEGATSLSSEQVGQQSSFTPSRINIGNDEAYTPELLDGRVFNLKVWDTNLTSAELFREMYSIRPVRIADLNRWCPLTVPGDYSDWTSNGGDFSLQTGSITKSIYDNPNIGWGRTSSGLYVPSSGPGVEYHDVKDTKQVHKPDTVTLFQEHALSTKDSTHPLKSDEANLLQTYSLSAKDTKQVHKSDEVLLEFGILQTVTLNLVDVDNVSQDNLTNLRWAWFDESDVESITTPTDQGSSETTDGSGELIIGLSFTTLTTGQFGLLALQTSDDVASALYRIAID